MIRVVSGLAGGPFSRRLLSGHPAWGPLGPRGRPETADGGTQAEPECATSAVGPDDRGARDRRSVSFLGPGADPAKDYASVIGHRSRTRSNLRPTRRCGDRSACLPGGRKPTRTRLLEPRLAWAISPQRAGFSTAAYRDDLLQTSLSGVRCCLIRQQSSSKSAAIPLRKGGITRSTGLLGGRPPFTRIPIRK